MDINTGVQTKLDVTDVHVRLEETGARHLGQLQIWAVFTVRDVQSVGGRETEREQVSIITYARIRNLNFVLQAMG